MNKASIPAILVIVLYLGFEMFAASKAGYRLEPLYIFDQLVAARVAETRCGNSDSEVLAQFDGTLGSIRRKALVALAEQHPERAEGIEAMLQQRQQENEQAVQDQIATVGCRHPALVTMKRRFAIYASRRLV